MRVFAVLRRQFTDTSPEADVLSEIVHFPFVAALLAHDQPDRDKTPREESERSRI
jgi:hypothetical protein